MSASIKVDLSRFNASLRRMKEVSKRTGAEIVNKALKDVAFRAASFTVKSSASKIRGELKGELLTKLAIIALRKKGSFNKNDVRDMKARILRARTSHVGALRAGWIPAIQALGGNYRGAKSISQGSAMNGTAIKATPSHISGLIRNTIRTRSAKGRTTTAAQIAELKRGLLKGIAYVTRDRNREARRRMLTALRRAKG